MGDCPFFAPRQRWAIPAGVRPGWGTEVLLVIRRPAGGLVLLLDHLLALVEQLLHLGDAVLDNLRGVRIGVGSQRGRSDRSRRRLSSSRRGSIRSGRGAIRGSGAGVDLPDGKGSFG